MNEKEQNLANKLLDEERVTEYETLMRAYSTRVEAASVEAGTIIMMLGAMSE